MNSLISYFAKSEPSDKRKIKRSKSPLYATNLGFGRTEFLFKFKILVRSSPAFGKILIVMGKKLQKKFLT